MSHGNKTIPKPESIRARTVRYMKELGTYKPEYNDMITIYSDLIYQYEKAKREFIEEGEAYEVETHHGSTKKSGTVSAMERLRVDIGTYSDRLLLNPKALGDEVEQLNPSDKFSQLINSIENSTK